MITNFEKYVGKIKVEMIEYGDFFCIVASIKNKNNLCDDDCSTCRMSCLDWLKEEYKEPFKLTKWEYDLILNCTEANGYCDEDTLKEYWIIEGMKDKGYFKGIDNLNITFKKVKDNHIIIEENYEDFDQNCK